MAHAKRLLYSAALLMIGVRTAHSDASPRSLRMRSPVRVAQVEPDTSNPDASPPDTSSPDAAPTSPPAGEQPSTTEPPPAEAPPAPSPPVTPGTSNTTSSPDDLTDEELAKLAEEAAEGEEVITVTGSLIGRKEVDSPSPISVVDKAKIEAAGITNIGSVLQRLPAQGNAINAQNNNGGDGSTRIDLRSLGSNRSLVLLNGRRVVPSGLGADASVDLGTIPIAMIERVEVLKDGASAVYGSDAISGVVNIITRSDFQGSEATVYTGTSQRGDGTTYDLSFVTGQSNKKGNVTFGASYQQQKPVMAGERSFSKQVYSYDFACTPAMEAAGECTARVLSGSSAAVGGRIDTMNGGMPFSVPGCSTRYCTSDGQGGFRDFVNPTETELGDNYNFQPLNYLFTPSNRVNLVANGHYDITKQARVFFEGSYNNRKSEQQLAEEPLFTGLYGTPISADSIYNPFGVDVISYNRRLVEFGPRRSKQDISTTRLVAGIDGKISEDAAVFKNWKWEVSYNYGRTDGTNANTGNLILSRVQNALGPSMQGPNGPICVGTAGDATTEIPGCVPLNLFAPGNVSADAIKYLTFSGISAGYNEQRTALAQAAGKVVDLPNNGDISLAVGVNHRRERGGFTPDPLTSTGDTTGNAQQPTQGQYRAYEGFAELSVVPVSGLKYAKWVQLDAAARVYNYNTFGSGQTAKLGGLFRTVGGLAFRGTYGTAFRAPNVGELYSGRSDDFPAIEDPCDTQPPSAGGETITLDPTTAAKCAAQGVAADASFGTSQQRAKVGGNPNLNPETANVATAGIVYEPLEGLALTLDYWNIGVFSAIATMPIQTVLSNCYGSTGPESDAFCAQIERNPATGEIVYITNLIQNVGSLKTSGLDFSLGYQYKTGVGQLRHSIEGTYLFNYDVETGGRDPMTGQPQVIKGKGNYDLGVQPAVKLNVFTTWLHGSGFGAGFNARYVDSFKECDGNNCNDPTSGSRVVSRYATGDLFVDYTVKSSEGTTRVALGVNNIIDAMPPVIYNGAALNADESAYDFMGRFFYVRLSQLF